MSISVLLALCPSCPIGVEARSRVFSESFWINATYALLPFVIVGAVIFAVIRHLDRGASRGDHTR